MTSPIASTASPLSINHESLWRALGQLVDRVFGVLEADSEAALDGCLDVIVDLLRADRGLVVLVMPDGTTRAINARRQGASLTADERDEVSRTIVRDALDSEQCVVFQPDHSATRSAVSLGIVGALAVKLRASSPEAPRAVLYVDYRDARKLFSQYHVDFFSSAAQLVGALLTQHARGESTRAHLRAARGHTTESRRTPPLAELLGTTSTRRLLEDVMSALGSEAPVLILGESGTGKTLLAHAIAEASGRRPLVRATLGASDDLNTITSELFGHERGAFSGAASKRVGLVEYANEGTLILDELLNMPIHAQKLLLDFTQFGTYRPLGYQRAEPRSARVRIIAATNGDLNVAIRDGRFREDLFHRLAHVVLEMPPLRARRADIPALAEAALARGAPARAMRVSDRLRALLVSPALPWSGNMRQLERVVGRARDRALMRDPDATELLPEHLDARELDGVEPSAASAAPIDEGSAASPGVEWQKLQAARSRIDEREIDVIRAVLALHDGNVSRAARDLGVARSTLGSRLDMLGIKRRGEAG